ncbi:hypothetical protein POJ06DRAFT_279840 [Lipomyces tetrasporus]|uniref:Uncharacterized protein n=1 Tax=Lipomyces tetrasporus TaxID=54092 RepID=A0AAD7VWS9_9ASCO|nr:uncharacterized protein POJ06DRAFT_279840 [Lipomyces tetrasporus]KAJ8104409.1 hypothetical protein POJ06DRAFT_279840 [Lipomyces tetrasporus]
MTFRRARQRIVTTTRNSPTPASDRPDMHRGKRFKSESSPTTSVTLTTDTSLQKDENALSGYEKALSLLKHNPPERRLDVHLPYSEYLKLDESWSNTRSARNISEDQKYPYLAYNTVAEIVTVVTVPRDLHEGPAVNLGPMILTGAQEYLSSHGADASLIVNLGSTTIMGRYGRYAKIKKQADGTIMYNGTGAQAKVMNAIEVGYRPHVKVCILVCLDESPRFRNPDSRYEHVANVDVEMEAMARCVAESLLIQNAWSSNRLPKSINLKMSDFVPDEDLVAANIPDGSLSFDGNLNVHILRKCTETTAEQRYQEFIAC